MSFMKYSLVISLLLLTHVVLRAKPEPRRYTIRNIGSENSSCRFNDCRVNCIYEDSDGFIWIGTGATVERLNGRATVAYNFPGKRNSLPSPFLVNALLENHKHEIYAGNIQGLWKLNHDSLSMERVFAREINVPVKSLGKDNNHNIYIGTSNGLYISDGGQPRHIMIDERNSMSADNQILAIEVADVSQVWLLTSNNIVLCDAKSSALRKYPCTIAACGAMKCMEKVGNKLYIGSENGHIVTFDLDNRVFDTFRSDMMAPVTALKHNKNTLGVGTHGRGISLLEIPGANTCYSVACGTAPGQDLLSNDISSIHISGNGDIRCGSDYYLGMDHLHEEHRGYSIYGKGLPGLRGVTVRSHYRTPRYTFIGTREGFYYVDEQTGTTRKIDKESDKSHRLRSNLIFSFGECDGDILVGTCGGGLASFNPQTGTFRDTPLTLACTSNDIFMFMHDGETLWLATSDGLYAYNKRTGQIREYNSSNSGLPGNIVYGIHRDSAGRFWVGTDKGLTLLNPLTGKSDSKTLPKAYRDRAVRTIYEGNDGTLFFCRLDYSLFVADKNLKRFGEPLPVACCNIIQDNHGNYWLGRDDGLLRVSPKLDTYELIPGINEISVSAGTYITKDENGMLWIDTMKGLYMVNPVAAFGHSPTRVTDILVNGRPYANGYTLDRSTTLQLDNDENTITLHFLSLGYESPEKTKYQYLLEGRDTAWAELTNDDKVSYYRLPAGDYVFRVRKFMDAGSEDSVRFSIAPSRAWLAYAAIGLSLLIVIGLMMGRRYKDRNTAARNERDLARLAAMDSAAQESDSEQLATTESAQQQSNSNVKLSEEEAGKVAEALKTYMREQEPFLNVDIKQSDIAAAIGCPTYILSATFTHYLKTGYYDFINGYRVERFKTLVDQGLHKKYTVVTLGEKCGFKSKASFFRAFKKFTGTTPNDYIRQYDGRES